MKLLNASLLALILSLPLLPSISIAGFNDGLAAANKGDFDTALREWKPLPNQGNTDAQINLGLMDNNGQGVPKDFKEAVKW